MPESQHRTMVRQHVSLRAGSGGFVSFSGGVEGCSLYCQGLDVSYNNLGPEGCDAAAL